MTRPVGSSWSPGGSYVGPGRFFELRGELTIVDSSPTSKDNELAGRLWEISAREPGIGYA